MKKFKRSIQIIFTSFLTFVLVLVTLFFVTPFISVATYRVFANGGSLIELNDNDFKYEVTLDISYNSVYDNGYLDYYVPSENYLLKPTIIWIYSENYFEGDKEDLEKYIPHYVNEGYNVAVLNYQRNASTKFTTAINQVNEAYQYLIDNSEALMIDVNNIFIAGSNTGAIIASQFITANYVESYREALSLDDFNANIAGALLFYGIEDIKPFNQVVEISDLLYQRINWTYYNMRNWLNSDRYIFNHELDNLPNVYITESNNYEYIKEGKKLNDLLPNSKYYNPDSGKASKLPHNYFMYLNDDNEIGDEATINFNNSIEFMKEIIKN